MATSTIVTQAISTLTTSVPDWIEVRDEHNHLVCEYSPRENRVRTKVRNGSVREAVLPIVVGGEPPAEPTAEAPAPKPHATTEN